VTKSIGWWKDDYLNKRIGNGLNGRRYLENIGYF